MDVIKLRDLLNISYLLVLVILVDVSQTQNYPPIILGSSESDRYRYYLSRLDILKKVRDHFQARNVWTSDGKIVVKTGEPNNPKLTTLTTHRELQAMVATPTTPAPTSTPAPDGLRNVNTRRSRLL